jgi:hypothetical protein
MTSLRPEAWFPIVLARISSVEELNAEYESRGICDECKEEPRHLWRYGSFLVCATCLGRRLRVSRGEIDPIAAPQEGEFQALLELWDMTRDISPGEPEP